MSEPSPEFNLDALAGRFRDATASGERVLVLSFTEVESILGWLPSDASVKKAWWTGTRQAHAKIWTAEGWRVSNVGFRMRRVAFERVTP